MHIIYIFISSAVEIYRCRVIRTAIGRYVPWWVDVCPGGLIRTLVSDGEAGMFSVVVRQDAT